VKKPHFNDGTSCVGRIWCACPEHLRRWKLVARAHWLVHQAVLRGELPPPVTLACVDCGRQAAEYDHRDYEQPLVVVAVCRRCNRRRGFGLPLAPRWRERRAKLLAGAVIVPPSNS
jgi:hypothetical protein